MLFKSMWKVTSWLDLFASMPWISSSFTFLSDTHWTKRRSNMTIMLPFLQSKKWHKRKTQPSSNDLCLTLYGHHLVNPITLVHGRSCQVLSLFHRWKKENLNNDCFYKSTRYIQNITVHKINIHVVQWSLTRHYFVLSQVIFGTI